MTLIYYYIYYYILLFILLFSFQGMGGVGAAVASVLVTATGSSPLSSGFSYFVIAGVCILICLISYLTLPFLVSRNDWWQHLSIEIGESCEWLIKITSSQLFDERCSIFSSNVLCIEGKRWSMGRISVSGVFRISKRGAKFSLATSAHTIGRPS